jgi:hypothetical protein
MPESSAGGLPLGIVDPGSLQTATITEVPSLGAVTAGGGLARAPSTQRMPMAAGATMLVTPAGATTTHLPPSPPLAPPLAPGVTVPEVNAMNVDVDTALSNAGAAQMQPKVESPAPELDVAMSMGDLLNQLNSAASAELLLNDEMSKDELWDALFGQAGQPPNADGGSSPPRSGAAPGSPSLPANEGMR